MFEYCLKHMQLCLQVLFMVSPRGVDVFMILKYVFMIQYQQYYCINLDISTHTEFVNCLHYINEAIL